MSRSKLDTRTRILNEAYSEFLFQGYKRADLRAIVKRAGVTKGALYYYFKSKEDLASAVVDQKLVSIVEGIQDRVRTSSGESALQTMLDTFTHSLSDDDIVHGSVLVKFANEVPVESRELRSRIKTIFDSICQNLKQQADEDQGRNKIDDSIDTEQLAHLLCATLLGSMVLTSTYRERIPLDNAVRQLGALLAKPDTHTGDDISSEARLE